MLHGGTVLVGDEAGTRARSVGITGGRVVAVSDEDLPGVRRVDLRGRTVVPGFHDAHVHTSWYGTSLAGLPLARMESVEQIYDAVRDAVSTAPPGQWVIGSGIHPSRTAGVLPTLRELDRLAPNNPVWLIASSGHASVVNTRVVERLDRAEAERFGPLPVEADGELTGFLEEHAHACVLEQAQPYGIDDVVTAIGRAHRDYVAEGITAVQEAGVGAGLVGYGRSEVAAYQGAREQGQLLARTTLMPSFMALHHLERGGGAAPALGLDLGIRSGFGDHWLRLGPVKFFTDGSVLAGTADLHGGYPNGLHSEKGQLYDKEDVRRRILGAHAAGWQIAVHAQGDAAIDFTLGCLEEAQGTMARADPRHRIEHCSMTSDDAVRRIAELGVVPSPQGRFIGIVGDGLRAMFDQDELHGVYRMKSYLDAGITVAGSSDRPCTEGRPLDGIHDMVNRRTHSGVEFGSEEAVTPQQALRSYAYGSAYAAHMETWVGTLEPGQVADLAILSDDPTTVDPTTIRDIQVTATAINGRPVHDPDAMFG